MFDEIRGMDGSLDDAMAFVNSAVNNGEDPLPFLQSVFTFKLLDPPPQKKT